MDQNSKILKQMMMINPKFVHLIQATAIKSARKFYSSTLNSEMEGSRQVVGILPKSMIKLMPTRFQRLGKYDNDYYQVDKFNCCRLKLNTKLERNVDYSRNNIYSCSYCYHIEKICNTDINTDKFEINNIACH